MLLIENNIIGRILSIKGDRYVKPDEKETMYKDATKL